MVTYQNLVVRRCLDSRIIRRSSEEVLIQRQTLFEELRPSIQDTATWEPAASLGEQKKAERNSTPVVTNGDTCGIVFDVCWPL